jgi:hypothetical protein
MPHVSSWTKSKYLTISVSRKPVTRRQASLTPLSVPNELVKTTQIRRSINTTPSKPRVSSMTGTIPWRRSSLELSENC